MFELDDRAALITGASRGIGRAIAERLAEAGADIVGLDVDPEPLEETRELVENAGQRFTPLVADVSEMQQMQAAVKDVVDEFGSLDILVNNAGITRDNLLIRMSEEDWESVISVNLTGVFNGTKAAARQMMRQRSGSIINISSVVGLVGNPGQVNYSASKAGVLGVTKSTAREVATRGVRVNAVAPGYIQTRMTEELGDDARERLLNQIPLGSLGEAQDVANAVMFLASDASSYLTGQVISVDGGMAM
ncbi:MAG: 3-oxoacyl-[acyl-carrier-protein] reductase [Planctomycetota bacterium]